MQASPGLRHSASWSRIATFRAENDVWESADGGRSCDLANPAAPREGRGLIHGSVVFQNEIYLIGGGLKTPTQWPNIPIFGRQPMDVPSRKTRLFFVRAPNALFRVGDFNRVLRVRRVGRNTAEHRQRPAIRGRLPPLRADSQSAAAAATCKLGRLFQRHSSHPRWASTGRCRTDVCPLKAILSIITAGVSIASCVVLCDCISVSKQSQCKRQSLLGEFHPVQ